MNTNQIPPGIIAFKFNNQIRNYKSDCEYSQWVNWYIGNDATIHTIEQDGKRYSVGSEVLHFNKRKVVIEAFKYVVDEWFAYDKNEHSYAVCYLSQPPEDKPASDLLKEQESKFIVECNVCGQRYENWVGSTPCCGSIAYRIDENGKKTSDFYLYVKIIK